MFPIRRMVIVALAVLTLAPACAVGHTPYQPVRTAHACLDQSERRAANESGKFVSLAAAIRSAKKRMPGAVVRASLCRGKVGLVYVLTVLARDGKVARLKVDALKGTLVGRR